MTYFYKVLARGDCGCDARTDDGRLMSLVSQQLFKDTRNSSGLTRLCLQTKNKKPDARFLYTRRSKTDELVALQLILERATKPTDPKHTKD